MKKAYSKPEMVFENFAVSASIAFTCEITNPYDDALRLSDGTYVFTADANCGGWVNESGGDGAYGGAGKYDSICYHVPDGFNLFDS